MFFLVSSMSGDILDFGSSCLMSVPSARAGFWVQFFGSSFLLVPEPASRFPCLSLRQRTAAHVCAAVFARLIEDASHRKSSHGIWIATVAPGPERGEETSNLAAPSRLPRSVSRLARQRMFEQRLSCGLERQRWQDLFLPNCTLRDRFCARGFS